MIIRGPISPLWRSSKCCVNDNQYVCDESSVVADIMVKYLNSNSTLIKFHSVLGYEINKIFENCNQP